MAEVFSARSLIYWWGVFSATVFIKGWLDELAKWFLGTDATKPKVFTPDKLPFSLVPSLNKGIDQVAENILRAVKFDPNQNIATIGTFPIPGYVLAVVVGLIFIAIAVSFLIRAVKSPAWYDDFIALFVAYVVLRAEGHILSKVEALPLLGSFRAFVDNPITAYAVLFFLLLGLSFIGEGVRSKRAFWRALFEAVLLSLLMFPEQTSNALGYVIGGLALFGGGLGSAQNWPFAIFWGVVGMFLAVQRLTTQEAAA